MKKLLVLTLTLASFGFLGLGSSEAKANTVMSTVTNTPQIRVQIGPQRHRRYRGDWGVRTTRTTRIVQWGRRSYRETYLVHYYANGRTDTTLISRERIG